MSVSRILASASSLLDQLFTRRRQDVLDVRGAYIAMRHRLADGEHIAVEEVELILAEAGLDPARLKADLELEAERRELVAKREAHRVIQDSIPVIAAEREKLKREYQEFMQYYNPKARDIEDRYMAANALANIVEWWNEKIHPIEAKLNDFGDKRGIPGRLDDDRDPAQHSSYWMANVGARPANPNLMRFGG